MAIETKSLEDLNENTNPTGDSYVPILNPGGEELGKIRVKNLPVPTAAQSKSEKGIPDGYAPLDELGRVPIDNLPPNPILAQYDTFASFPTTGDTMHLYLDKSTGQMYIWNTDTSEFDIIGTHTMITDIYDTNLNGKVDIAENSELFDNKPVSDFLLKNNNANFFSRVIGAPNLQTYNSTTWESVYGFAYADMIFFTPNRGSIKVSLSLPIFRDSSDYKFEIKITNKQLGVEASNIFDKTDSRYAKEVMEFMLNTVPGQQIQFKVEARISNALGSTSYIREYDSCALHINSF